MDRRQRPREARVGKSGEQACVGRSTVHELAQQVDQHQFAEAIDRHLPAAVVAAGFVEQHLEQVGELRQFAQIQHRYQGQGLRQRIAGRAAELDHRAQQVDRRVVVGVDAMRGRTWIEEQAWTFET